MSGLRGIGDPVPKITRIVLRIEDASGTVREIDCPEPWDLQADLSAVIGTMRSCFEPYDLAVRARAFDDPEWVSVRFRLNPLAPSRMSVRTAVFPEGEQHNAKSAPPSPA